MDDKQKLANLYVRKGEIITQMEYLQQNLQKINQQIYQITNQQQEKLEETEKKE